MESGFVLRLLLQHYKIEKQNRYKMLKEGFQTIQTIGEHRKFVITFTNFKKLMDLSCPKIPEIEVAQLYREAYAAGHGQLTVESFFTVANESGFFTRYLRLPSDQISPAILDDQGNFLKPGVNSTLQNSSSS